MPITARYEDTGTTIGSTEYSLCADSNGVSAQTDDGCYEAWIDFNAITYGADEFEIKVYEKVRSGGTQRVVLGPISVFKPEVVRLPSLLLIHGYDYTVKKLQGTDRSITWSIRRVFGTAGVTESHTNTATISTSEYSLPNNSAGVAAITTDGCFQAFVDFNAITAVADEFEFKLYEKIASGGTQRVIWAPISINKPEVLVTPASLLLHGWDMTVAKFVGTDASIPWSIRQIA
jgi:hypothetical protein